MNIDLLSNHLAALASGLSDRMAAASSLSESADAALLTLRHFAPLPVTELARILGLSQPAATRLVAGLRRDGLVAETDSNTRLRPLSLTIAGRERATALQRARAAEIADLLALLPPADQQALDRIIRRLLVPLTESPAQARHLCRFCDHGLCRGDACPVGCEARRMTATQNGPDAANGDPQ